MGEAWELELALHGADEDGFVAELRWRRPDDEAEAAPVRVPVRFDLAALAACVRDGERHGEQLSASLFAAAPLRERFLECLAAAEGRVRLRLYIGETAAELHALRWEALRHPRTGAWLLCDEQVRFSRLIAGVDWRPVRLRARGELRALVVVASPAGLADYGLAAIDVAGEVARAQAGLGAIASDVLATDAGAGRFATLAAIAAAMRRPYDIVHLVCHGRLRRGSGPAEPVLLLDREDGGVHLALGRQLVERVRDAADKPALVVLASCASAGDDDGLLAGLGPALAQAGVPAVVAMRGDLSMATARALVPTLFAELQRDGRIDRALAAARGQVREARDAWAPALFTRLRDGRIWASAAANFRPSRWVVVAGVGRAHIPAAAVRVARAVGSALGRRGYGLIVGGWEGVDYVAAEAFAAEIAARRRPLSASLRQYVAIHREPHFRGGDVVYTRQGVTEWISGIREACAVVLIGGADEREGNDGTYETWGYGLQEQRPCFPFARLPGGSSRAYREMLADFDDPPLPGIDRAQFVRALGGPLDDDAGVARAVEELLAMIDRCE
jgi:hypothetical protein